MVSNSPFTSGAQFPERVGRKLPDTKGMQTVSKSLETMLYKPATHISNVPASTEPTSQKTPPFKRWTVPSILNKKYAQPSQTLPMSGALYKGVLWRRIIAFGIDLLIISIIVAMLSRVLAVIGVKLALWGAKGWSTTVYASLGFITTMAYNALQIGGEKQATLGMQIIGLKVTTPVGGRPALKSDVIHVGLFYVLSAMVFPVIIDFISALQRSDRRTLRDRLSGYVVVRANEYDRMQLR